MTRLAIVSSHPIQYNAPAFAAVANEPGIDLRVFYEWEKPSSILDHDFGRAVEWDIPLFDGYEHTFVSNSSSRPSSGHFFGIDSTEIIPALEAWAPDVILIYGWAFASHVRILRHFHGRIPIMFRGDSTLLRTTTLVRRAARRAVLKLVFKKIDVALYAGSRNRDYFQWAGVPESSLAWAPHAIDNDRFAGGDGETRRAGALRTRLGIASSDIVFLFVGKLTPIKDPHTMLIAFRSVLESTGRRDIQLVIAGDGQLGASLRHRANGLRQVHFIGFQNQSTMPTIYRMADALVLPSVSETWGLAVNEAMAASRPAIVSDRVGCAADLVVPGQTGVVFPQGDSSALQMVMGALADRGVAYNMGQQAHKLIQKWSIPRFASSVAKAAAQLNS